MRIFLSYPTAPDKGEGRFVRDGLLRMGHEVHVIDVASSTCGLGWQGRATQGFAPDISFHDLTALFGSPDLFLYIEPDGLIPLGMRDAPCPTACIISDTHRRLAPRVELARHFDHVFLYQRNYVRHFTAHEPGHVHWHPYGCDEHFFRDQSLPRDLDVAFVGQPGAPGTLRARGVAALAERWALNPQRPYTQREMGDLYARAKIVVNFPVGDDLNFRFFEALSCGALLVTQRINNGQNELFRDGEHFVSFCNERDLVEKVTYFLGHAEERERIAAAGHAESLHAHTLERRLQSLLATVAQGGAKGSPIRSLSRLQGLRAWLAFTARQGRLDAIVRIATASTTSVSEQLLAAAYLVQSLARIAALAARRALDPARRTP